MSVPALHVNSMASSGFVQNEITDKLLQGILILKVFEATVCNVHRFIIIFSLICFNLFLEFLTIRTLHSEPYNKEPTVLTHWAILQMELWVSMNVIMQGVTKYVLDLYRKD